MKEFIEKLIYRLEKAHDRNNEKKKEAYKEKDWERFDLFTHINEGIYGAIEIANELAEEYNQEHDDTDYANIELYAFWQKHQWILCSERLPEVSGEYYTYVYYDGHYMYSVDEIDCDGIIKEWNCASDYQIIAWKQIAPYQPKGE